MEQVKHIENISIENFKCFRKIQIDNFGLYNIILGNNNAGKTSFLESLVFDENSTQTISNLQGLLHFKRMATDSEVDFNSLNPLPFFINKVGDNNYIRMVFSYKEGDRLDISYHTERIENLNEDQRKNFYKHSNFSKEKEVLKVIKNNTSEYKSFDIDRHIESYDVMIPFMGPSAFYAKDLVGYYSDFFSDSKEKKKDLVQQLKTIIPNIFDIELTVNYIDNVAIIGIWQINSDSLIPLPMFGDGTIRLFRMIMEIVVSKNKYLCIDEIDTGIHYSKYKDFCRIVLSTAESNNVQLFITTHNNEFLKAFKEVLEEENFNDFQNITKCFTLKKLPDESIKAYRYNFDEFEFAIEQENELR